MNSGSLTSSYVLRWLALLAGGYALASVAVLAASDDTATVFAELPLLLFAQFLLLVSAGFALRACRWLHLVRAAGVEIDWRSAVKIYIGGFPMALTPGRAGELWRAWALHRVCGARYRRGVPIVVGDRLLDLNVLLLFAALGVFSAAYRWPALAAVLVMLPLLLLLLFPGWLRRVAWLLWRLAGRRWRRQFAALLAALRQVGGIARPAVYLPALLLSLAAWGVEGLALYHVVTQLGGLLSAPDALATLGLGNIAGVLTLLPGGIGGQEATMIYLLHQNGNSVALAAVATATVRIGTIFYAAVLGMPFFLRYSRRVSAWDKMPA